MELRHLRYFLQAAEDLHFGRAAEQLFVTRPAVSQTISDLEAELGVKLFLRHAHKVTLTSAGLALQKSAQVLMADLTHALEVTKRTGQGKIGHINVGYGTLSLQHPMFRAAIKALRRDYSGIDVSLHEVPSSEQIRQVRNRKLDAGFVIISQEALDAPDTVPEFMSMAGLNMIIIESGWLSVAVAPDHPFAKRSSISLADIAGEELVIVKNSNVSPSFARLDAMCRTKGFSPRVVQEVSNIITQVNLISVGVGIGLVFAAPRMHYGDNVRIISLTGVEFAAHLAIVWREGPAEPALDNFISIAKSLSETAML